MSTDAQVREATRHRALDPSVHRAALLGALRAGTLSERWLRLAAFAHDQEARTILGLHNVHDLTSEGHEPDGACRPDRCEEVSDGGSPPQPEHAPGRLCLDRSLGEFVDGLVTRADGRSAVVRREMPIRPGEFGLAFRAVAIAEEEWPGALGVAAVAAALEGLDGWADSHCTLCLGERPRESCANAHRPHPRGLRDTVEVMLQRSLVGPPGTFAGRAITPLEIPNACPMASFAIAAHLREPVSPLDREADWGPGAAREALSWAGRYILRAPQPERVPRWQMETWEGQRAGRAIDAACRWLRRWALSPERGA